MDSIQLGDVEITRIVELQGGLGSAREMIPGSPPELWAENRSWLAPDHYRPESGAYRGAVQTWVLRSEGRTVLVDTGVGNDRQRPQAPLFDHLRTPFLDRLAAAGVRPEDVDVVVNTHIHNDHVGWNTRLRDGEWVPTFPNATYLIPRADAEYFAPHRAHLRRPPKSEWERIRQDGSLLTYADSITPVLDQAVLWEDGHRIDGSLRLEPAPGHTPGSAVLRLSSGTDRAAFVGDLLHSPVQILRPALNSCFCEDPATAATTRHRVLEQAADHRELVIPAHFPGSSAAEIHRNGTRFALTRWAALPPRPDH